MNRLNFQNELLKICKNVYFQPPSNNVIKYPCIIYSLKQMHSLKAADSNHVVMAGYDVVALDKNPDSDIIKKLMNFKYTNFNKQFVSNGVYNTNFTIYY